MPTMTPDVPPWIDRTVTLGATAFRSRRSTIRFATREVWVIAVTEIGTSCRFCSRFWAVTTTSSSCALCASAGVATRAEPASSTALLKARRRFD
jgi:predicted transcriptional regulator